MYSVLFLLLSTPLSVEKPFQFKHKIQNFLFTNLLIVVFFAKWALIPLFLSFQIEDFETFINQSSYFFRGIFLRFKKFESSHQENLKNNIYVKFEKEHKNLNLIFSFFTNQILRFLNCRQIKNSYGVVWPKNKNYSICFVFRFWFFLSFHRHFN